ncbi:MAG: hypothetical protein AB1Z98_05565, partial [Nannocystaceae bacterium]
MSPRTRPRYRSFVLALALGCALDATGCRKDDAAQAKPGAPAEPEPATPADVPAEPPRSVIPEQGPLPELRTGALEPERLPPAEAELLAHAEDGAHFYELQLPQAWQDADQVVRVHVQRPARAVATVQQQGGTTKVLVRAPTRAGAATRVEGTAFVLADRAEGDRWLALPFAAEGAAKDPADSGLPDRWRQAFASELLGEDRPWQLGRVSHPWREFAAGRVRSGPAGAPGTTGGRVGAPVVVAERPRRTELSELMHTTTAATSMQEALQHDRGLRLGFETGPATVSLSELSSLGLVEHPWATMRAALPESAVATPEPLAAAAP